MKSAAQIVGILILIGSIGAWQEFFRKHPNFDLLNDMSVSGEFMGMTLMVVLAIGLMVYGTQKGTTRPPHRDQIPKDDEYPLAASPQVVLTRDQVSSARYQVPVSGGLLVREPHRRTDLIQPGLRCRSAAPGTESNANRIEIRDRFPMTEDQEQQLDEIIADYLEAQESGHPPDREAVIAAHPHLAAARSASPVDFTPKTAYGVQT